MSKDGDKSAKSARRSQKQPTTQQQVLVQKKKKRDFPSKDAQICSDVTETQSDKLESVMGEQTAGVERKQAGRAVSSEHPRKLSDASNASEDLSKDSGCTSGKVSSSDSSSEISDCASEGNKHDSPSCDKDLSWIEGRAYVSPESEGTAGCIKVARPAAAEGFHLKDSQSQLMEFMMGGTAEDLARELEDMRSENEYLKDEVEELRCEMLEMRDMFQEEEVYQLQELRLQLEQANKTCRILQYRLRKVERRSIRVAQTGQVDGELVRSLEHDIKVAKSVSLHLYNELEVVRKRNSQLEWENEALREKTQQQEVAKQVLQTEVEKARENSLKKRSVRSTSSKAERRLSQQMEDDNADLKCQLHFAKEELALMCKKLAKLVSDSEAMREELVKYQAVYGDLEGAPSAEGKRNSGYSRETEVKVHLKLVEEEATLLSRRIVELEVENRGLRAEMSDLREKGGEEENVVDEQMVKNEEKSLKKGGKVKRSDGCEKDEERRDDAERLLPTSQLHAGQTITAHETTREGPVGGEWDASDNQDDDISKKLDPGLQVLTVKDCETLLALRDHACILTSAIQLLVTGPRNGHSSPPCTLVSPTDPTSNGKAQGSLCEALELLQAMLLTFIGRMESLVRGDDTVSSVQNEKCAFLFANPKNRNESKINEEEFNAADTKQRDKQTRQSVTDTSKDPQIQLPLQILWVLHQWCKVKGPGVEGKEGREKTLSVLMGLLQDLSTEMQEDSEIQAARLEGTERGVIGLHHDRQHQKALRVCSSKGNSSFGARRKNWCYLSQEAAQLDPEDPIKTWDHLIMPLSFPDLDFEKMSMRRSHTAPEKSTSRIYYSPPSARRVQLIQLKNSPVADRGSVDTSSPWCTPPTSFSQLCLGSSANLSDDMKEMSASWRHTVHLSSQEKKGKSAGRWVDVACSGTQTHMKPQMVSVGQQTDGTVRNSSSRVLSSSLVTARSQHISTSLDGIPSRVERSRASTSSPKLYRRHSSLPSPSSLSSSSSSSTSSCRDRVLWNTGQQTYPGLTWTRQKSPRSGSGLNQSSANSSSKLSIRSSTNNRCGLVTEFLRRVSGRADKTPPPQKTKNLKNLERVPARPQAAPLHRNDSVTRIVNQRFMKNREEVGRTQREEKGVSLNQKVRNSQSNTAPEDGNYDCSSSSTLTFCFARPSRSNQRQTSIPGKQQRNKYSPPVGVAADPNCG